MEEHPEIQDPRISVGTFLSEALEYHAEDQLFQELGHNGEDAVKYVAREFLDGQSQLFTQRSSKAEYYRSLSRPLSDRATQYVADVVATFAFGFEPASMALCRACLEQILKDTLVDRKVYTRPYLDRNGFSAKWYVEEAKKKELLTNQGYEAGKRIVDKG